MINFSKIPAGSFLGRFLRGILRLIPQNSVLPILQGKLRGSKWIIGSANFGHWLGTYEPEIQKIFSRYVKTGNVVFDIGAHAGFYTLLASKLVGPAGRVFAFEPLPANVGFLKKHVALNKCSDVTVIEAAVCDRDGESSFQRGRNTFSGALSDAGDIKVKAVSLDNLVQNENVPPPDFIKIDVEGAEFAVLKGAREILKKYNPVLCLALDDWQSRKKCIDFLSGLSYRVRPIGEGDILETGSALALPEN